MSGMSQALHNKKSMKDQRRALRKEPTRAEVLLWECLRGNQLKGRKFRRQHSVGSYVLDFYCPTERLAIEVDGSVHNEPDVVLHDRERDEALAGLAVTTVRITNDEVENDMKSVLSKIKACFR